MTVDLITVAVNSAADIPAWFVVCMGVGTVFVGLIFIIIICEVVSLFFRNSKPKETAVPQKTVQSMPTGEERGKIVAAVCAAAAEDMGTDISALRVVSFKKL